MGIGVEQCMEHFSSVLAGLTAENVRNAVVEMEDCSEKVMKWIKIL